MARFKEQVARGVITITIPFSETFTGDTDEDTMYGYIENHIFDYVQNICEDEIRLENVEIDDIDVEDYFDEDECMERYYEEKYEKEDNC